MVVMVVVVVVVMVVVVGVAVVVVVVVVVIGGGGGSWSMGSMLSFKYSPTRTNLAVGTQAAEQRAELLRRQLATARDVVGGAVVLSLGVPSLPLGVLSVFGDLLHSRAEELHGQPREDTWDEDRRGLARVSEG